MKIAIIGSGISGLDAAYLLDKHADIAKACVLGALDTCVIARLCLCNDSKMDDGRPLTGKVNGWYGISPSGNCYTGSSYNISGNQMGCVMFFQY